MNIFFLFLTIFFGIIGIAKSVRILHEFVIGRISNAIFKKNKEEIKIWVKL